MAKKRKEKMVAVCRHCLSDEVSTTATVQWDSKKHCYTILDVHNDGWCCDCGGDTRIDEITEGEWALRKEELAMSKV